MHGLHVHQRWCAAPKVNRGHCEVHNMSLMVCHDDEDVHCGIWTDLGCAGRGRAPRSAATRVNVINCDRRKCSFIALSRDNMPHTWRLSASVMRWCGAAVTYLGGCMQCVGKKKLKKDEKKNSNLLFCIKSATPLKKTAVAWMYDFFVTIHSFSGPSSTRRHQCRRTC